MNAVFLLMEKGHVHVFDYSISWFHAMIETHNRIEEERRKASVNK